MHQVDDCQRHDREDNHLGQVVQSQVDRRPVAHEEQRTNHRQDNAEKRRSQAGISRTGTKLTRGWIASTIPMVDRVTATATRYPSTRRFLMSTAISSKARL